MRAEEPSAPMGQTLEVAAAISTLVQTAGKSVAVAESLASGSISSHLGNAESSDWYRGGVTAYSSEVKFSVLPVKLSRPPRTPRSLCAKPPCGIGRKLRQVKLQQNLAQKH